VCWHLGELRLERPHYPLELGMDFGRVGLLDDGSDQGGHLGLRGVRDLSEQIPQIMGPTALPGGRRKTRPDHGDQGEVGIGGNEAQAGKPSGNEASKAGE
jgi:hypothetical protein